MSIMEKLIQIAVNTQKAYDAGYNKAVKEVCPPINETGMVVQCCPLKGQPFIIESVGDTAGVVYITVCGKNLYNAEAYPLDTSGYVRHNNGVFSEDSGSTYRFTKTPIPAQHLRGQIISIRNAPSTTNGVSTGAGIAFYDSDDEYISGTNKAQAAVPSNTSYIRFSINKDYVNEAQIELGSVVTGYSPYTQNIIGIADFSELPMEIDPLKGLNTVFAYEETVNSATEVSVTGTADPREIIKILNEYMGAAASASV